MTTHKSQGHKCNLSSHQPIEFKLPLNRKQKTQMKLKIHLWTRSGNETECKRKKNQTKWSKTQKKLENVNGNKIETGKRKCKEKIREKQKYIPVKHKLKLKWNCNIILKRILYMKKEGKNENKT